MSLPLTVHRVGEGEVGVGELGEDVIGGLGQFSGSGQQLLLRLGESVGAAALDIVEVAAVEGELGELGIKFLQTLLGRASSSGTSKAVARTSSTYWVEIWPTMAW